MKKLILFSPFILGFVLSCNMGTQKPECEPEGLIIAEGARTEATILFTTEDEKYWRQGQWGEKIDHKKLIDAVFDAVYKGKAVPYDFFDNTSLSIEKIKEIETKTDTLWTENPDSGTMEMKVIQTGLDRDEITKVFFKENWYFDIENFKFYKKVIGLTLITNKYDNNGEILGQQPLFSIYFDSTTVGISKGTATVDKPVH